MTVLRHSGKLALPLMNLIRSKGMPILEQLQLEEKLLRTSADNWCIVNDGTNSPSIVMGVSGKPAELLNSKLVLAPDGNVPVIRRFTGGGTVIVDGGTIFVTLICNKDAIPKVQPYPRSIMQWSGILYDQVFQGIGDFHLRENDYVFGDRKFGGNAQSITKSRWVHHTSFLWDYEDWNMEYLKLPSRAPGYRLARDHTEFVCRMREYMQRPVFMDRTIEALENWFSVQPVSLADVGGSPQMEEFVPTTRILSRQELEAAFASAAGRMDHSPEI
ncbi:Inactive lipoate--protein ligase 2 [Linum grandiflorum]